MSAKKVSHADYVARVEAILRDAGRPYVAVDDAKKAIFSGCQTGNFDFLIYMAEGNHLLATVLPKSRPDPTAEQQADLRQWVRVFGAGFDGAFIHATDEPTAWLLDQERRPATPLRSVLTAGWGKDGPAEIAIPPENELTEPPRAPSVSSGGSEPLDEPLVEQAPPEEASGEQRQAMVLGYLFPGAQPVHKAELEPMLF